MPYTEHPDIEKVNQDGYLGTALEERQIETCSHCDTEITRGDKVFELYDHVFCDEECLTEAFCKNPIKYGTEVKIIA